MTMPHEPAVLLVHGAWHGAWCWEEVRPELRMLGVDTMVVALPSTGDAEQGLYADARAVRAAADAVDRPVVVVAHGYGGLPVTEGLAGAPNVVHLVYAASPLLGEGEARCAVPLGDGRLVMPPEDAAQVMYGDLAPDEVVRAVARLRPHSLRAFTELLTRAAWRDIPSTLVLGDTDRSLSEDLVQRSVARATEVRRVPGGVSPFYSAPAELAAIVQEAVRRVAPQAVKGCVA
ncbi:alpha/beta hydrolase [Kribbella sp. NPDC051770]|uniref:alpha/beta hydrolase n=1 Tax=Kribbella sp. NPDC051770 TaxID=3155413 RepID=UPI0034134002